MNTAVNILDTTLRDGAQSAAVSYTVKDKLKILDILDELGIGFAEAGAPAFIEKDRELFEILKTGPSRFSSLKPVAFVSTCREGINAADDPSLRETVRLAPEYISIYGNGRT